MMRTFILRMMPFARPAFWVALAFSFVMAIIPDPSNVPGEPSDKVLHMLAFGALTGLAGLGWPRMSLLGIFVRLSLFGVLIEIVQMIPALGRDAEWLDLAADMAAICLGLVGVAIWRRWLAPRLHRT